MTDELISVMVPKRHISRVYGFIAALDCGVTVPQSIDDPLPSSAVADDEWTPSRIRRMVEQSPPAMRDILRRMAEAPEQWITTAELAKSIRHKPDADWKTVAGTLGAFSRRIKNRYGLEKMPFEDRFDHSERGRVFQMSTEMAQQVLRSLANGQSV